MYATDCVLAGLDWAKPMMQFTLHVTCSCIPMHMFFLFTIFRYIWTALDFFNCLFLPLSLSLSLSLLFTLVRQWHQNISLLRSETFFILGHRLLLIQSFLLFDSKMRMPKKTSRRTFLDEVFIQNAKSFFRTSPTLTYPLSFIVMVGSHYVMSRSPVHPC